MNAGFALELQRELGLTDTAMARALKITRQTWRNWRTGRSFPPFAAQSLVILSELRRIDSDNDSLPELVRVKPPCNDNAATA